MQTVNSLQWTEPFVTVRPFIPLILFLKEKKEEKTQVYFYYFTYKKNA